MLFRFCSLPFLIALLFASCKKDPRVLDTSVQPENDLANSVNSEFQPLHAFTEDHDSIYSFNGPSKFLGCNIDPVFGRTEIGLYLNANFNTANLDLGDDPILVSAEFVFRIDAIRFAGEANAPLTFSIYPLDSALSTKRFYLTTNNRLHTPTPLPTMPVVASSTLSNGETVLRIPLDSLYAANLIKDKNSLVSNEVFHQTYKGFYIVAASQPGSQGVIHTCHLNEERSRLIFRYRRDSMSAPVDSLPMHFSGDRAVRYNTVRHDYSSAAPELQRQLAGDTTSPFYLYLQGMGGTRVHLDLPLDLRTSDSVNIAVNRAEIIFKVDENTIAKGYGQPPTLALLPVAISGRDTIANDQFNTGDNARYGGVYDKANKQYVFNIARHVQAVLNGERANRGFRLVVASPERAITFFRDDFFERVVLGGTANQSLKPTFKLTYSRIQVR